MKKIIYPEWTSWAIFCGLGGAVGAALGVLMSIFTGTQLLGEITLFIVCIAVYLVGLRKRQQINDIIAAEVPPEGEG